MIIDCKNWRFRLHCSLKHYITVEGINSLLPDSNHILMWDFDDTLLPDVITSLENVKSNWELPAIYVSESSSGHYHAYCFQSTPYPQALNILASTKGICQNFFIFGVIRGFWTLRISPEKGIFKHILVLDSPYKNQVPIDLYSLISTKYRTAVYKLGDQGR